MALFQKYNNEDILVRAVLAGLLDILNNQIKYEQVWGNAEDETEVVSVPWFYNQSGDERFNQDFYTHYAHCMPPKPADGNFDMIPRGVITYTGSRIDAQRITSRYVQGRYVKEINGQLESYVSYLYSLPLTLRIDCEMWIDRQVTALKIEQEIREVFYKTLTYYVYYKGLRIGSTVGFPEDVTIDKNIAYSFESDNKIKITFQLEIETYQPVFDPTTEMKTTSRIKGFGYNLYPKNEEDTLNSVDQIEMMPIQITTPASGAIIPKGIPIWVQWNANSRGKIINRVNVQWSPTGEELWQNVETVLPNNEYYVWNISPEFTNFKEPIIIWEEGPNVQISREPNIKIIPDLNTYVIDVSSFQILDRGYFVTGDTDASIVMQLEMRDDSNRVHYHDGFYGIVKNNILRDVSGGSVTFPGTVHFKQIDVRIISSSDTKTFGVASNITII